MHATGTGGGTRAIALTPGEITMTRSSRIIAAALGATLSLGALGLGTAVLPSAAGAQGNESGAAADSDTAGARKGHPRLRELARQELRLAADTIGIPPAELREAVEGGRSVSEVAEANGVATQSVIDAVVADLSARLDRAVVDGRITQERADSVEARLPERVTDVVNRHRVVQPG